MPSLFLASLIALTLGVPPEVQRSETTQNSQATAPILSPNRELDSIGQQALSLPPEFASDVLIRLGGRAGLFDKPTRIDYLTSAFRLAAGCQLAFPSRVKAGASLDTVEGRKNQAEQLGLDTLSLRCRAVKVMLPLSRQAAISLFDELDVPATVSVSCGNGLYPDLHVYYELLREVTAGAAIKDKYRYYVDALSRIQSVSQLEPFVRSLLTEQSLPEQEVSMLTTELAQRIHSLQPEAGGFTGAMESDGLIQRIESLCARLHKNEEDSAVANLLNETRSFIVRNMAISVCKSSSHDSDWNAEESMKVFNTNLLPVFNRSTVPIRPIESSEVAGAKEAPIEHGFVFWQSSQSSAIMELAKSLNRTGQSDEAKEKWVDRILEALSSWQSSSEPSLQVYFLEKGIILGELSALNPDGRDKS